MYDRTGSKRSRSISLLLDVESLNNLALVLISSPEESTINLGDGQLDVFHPRLLDLDLSRSISIMKLYTYGVF